MPYIITVRDPIASDQSKRVGDDGRLHYSTDGSEVFPGATGVRQSKGSTRAVVTLNEARLAAYGQIINAEPQDEWWHDRRMAAHSLPAVGGDILLPDNTIIEVQPITWAELATRADWPQRFAQHQAQPLEYQAIIDAFNAR